MRTRSLEPLDMMAMARVHAHLVDFVDEIDGVLREIDSVTERDDEELLESLLLQASLVLRDTLVVEDCCLMVRSYLMLCVQL